LIFSLPIFTPTVTNTPQPTPTDFPSNPIRMNDRDLYTSIRWGSGLAFGLLVTIELYRLFKKKSK
jgi:hypothetical protein